MHAFDVFSKDQRIAATLTTRPLRQFPVMAEGKQMQFWSIGLVSRHPVTGIQQDALLRLPPQMLTGAFCDEKEKDYKKFRVVLELGRAAAEISATFDEIVDALIPQLMPLAPALGNRKMSESDIRSLRIGNGNGALKLFADVVERGGGRRKVSRFYMDTPQMEDVQLSTLFPRVPRDERPQMQSAPSMSSAAAGCGEKTHRSSSIDLTPFMIEVLLNIEGIMIGPQSIKFVMTIVEGVVPPTIGVQVSLLREGKTWGGNTPAQPAAAGVVAEATATTTTDPMLPAGAGLQKGDDDENVNAPPSSEAESQQPQQQSPPACAAAGFAPTDEERSRTASLAEVEDHDMPKKKRVRKE